jgi:hypothetical protein
MSRYLKSVSMSLRPSSAVLCFDNRESALSFSTSSGPPVKVEVSAVRKGEKRAKRTLELHVLPNPIGNFSIETLLLGHLLLHVLPGELVELVYGGRDGADLVGGDTADVEDAVQNLAVVELWKRRSERRMGKSKDVATNLDGELANLERLENLNNDGENFSIGKHSVVNTGNVEVLQGK